MQVVSPQVVFVCLFVFSRSFSVLLGPFGSAVLSTGLELFEDSFELAQYCLKLV